ncbi:Endoribonuclease YbeY [Anatilimnocola aggregata]|uniref:Endoribonuclease YbeY n=1 Tax=Anatilimnocola aggregata TaxID=2528021 RepID=A0A517YII3_9BACT|nr:rRNA maturation RNase YbeY [Anatilimnocola aggregata]QDU30022.1 Endoribonuclease YbeY [Anatilimnocola aggregata]
MPVKVTTLKLRIDIADEQETHTVNYDRLIAAVKLIFADAGYVRGEVSIAIVTDEAMHDLNRQYLQHDYPTDVLSFVLEEDSDRLDGQLIVSADYASREAPTFGWTTDDELLLYTIHGALHLVGYDDLEPELKAEMREQEKRYLAKFGLTPSYS